MTVPAPVMHLGEVVRPEPDTELELATRQAVLNMNFLADMHQAQGFPEPEPGPAYSPPDYGEMTGTLICRICQREIREHTVGEWHR